MKKIALILALATVSTTLLAGCGKFTCDICGEEKSGKKHKSEAFGEEIVICDDCEKDPSAGIAKGLEKTLDNLNEKLTSEAE